jgi:hypothetical protein
MGASFIISMICRGFIIGEVPPLRVTPDHPLKQTSLLIVAGVIFLVLGLIVFFCRKACKKRYELPFVVVLLEKLLVQILLLTTSWCFLYALTWKWLKEFPGHQVMGRLMVAMSAGILFVICLLVLTQVSIAVKDPHFVKTTRPVYQMMSLLVGLSWEKTYDVALEQFVEGASTNETERTILDVLLNLCVVLVFLPGFGLLMMPKHDKELTMYYGDTRFSPWQVCFDLPCDESTEVEEGSEEDSQTKSLSSRTWPLSTRTDEYEGFTPVNQLQ